MSHKSLFIDTEMRFEALWWDGFRCQWSTVLQERIAYPSEVDRLATEED